MIVAQPFRGLLAEFLNDRLESVAGNVAVAAFVEIAEADLRCLLKSFELGGLLSLALLDQAQTLAQHLAGVLETAGPDQIGQDFFVVVRKSYIAGRHHLWPYRHWKSIATESTLCH